ncbi:methyl-accepting chemotaxis protein [Achromobacter sp. UMC46]|uniref:methyl-accepting chemotaxis protein n=1 Tax=Achromobacter sp. UMC46 TaxID=1862319 RepID=UPI0021082A1C|nr:methyl-accepting chemotaxis protein [Achromobacter sp. UMC46]
MQTPNRMKNPLITIKARLATGFALIFVLLATVGTFGYVGISTLATRIHNTYQTNTLPILDVGSVRSSTLRIRLMLWRAQAERKSEATDQLIAEIEKLRESLQQAWAHYYPAGISSPSERELAEKISARLGNFKEESDRVIAYLKEGDYENATRQQSDQLAPQADALSDLLDANVRDNANQADIDDKESIALARRIVLISLGLTLGGGVVALLVCVLLIRAVIRPLSAAVKASTRISEGKLGEPINVEFRDEFGQLLSALNRMDQVLANAVRGIRESSESVMVASSQIASGNLDLSARTEQQAASLEQTAATMAQITETVKQNADNASEANALAQSVSELSKVNNQAMDAMVGTMGSISGSSRKISDITSLIEGIAFQTNILALNAAVEAARAGEQGLGFAVVAREVRSLAQRSSAAAKEIKDLIGESSRFVQEGSRQASEVSTAMQDMTRAITKVSGIVSEIAVASDEQRRGVEEIHVAISQIDSVTQQNAALVEEAAAAAQSLEEQAKRMKIEVMFFQMRDETSSVGIPSSPKIGPATPC